jgi:hypothetical protein
MDMANPGNSQEYMRYINYNGIIYVLGGYFKGMKGVVLLIKIQVPQARLCCCFI